MEIVRYKNKVLNFDRFYCYFITFYFRKGFFIFIFSPWYSNPGAGAVRVDRAGGVRNDLGGLGGLEGKDVVI